MKYLMVLVMALSFGVTSASLTGAAAPVQTQNHAQSQNDEKIYKGSEVTVRAKILRRVNPSYTEEARRHRISGRVLVEVVLRASGVVTDIVVIKGLPYGLSDSAVRAAQATEFEPALKDGEKVSQRVKLEYAFNTY